MDEEALRPIRELLERVQERVRYAVDRLKSFEEIRFLRWQCTGCGHTERFTKPVPAEVAPPCPKCHGSSFGSVEYGANGRTQAVKRSAFTSGVIRLC